MKTKFILFKGVWTMDGDIVIKLKKGRILSLKLTKKIDT